jgi:hypothetical protein
VELQIGAGVAFGAAVQTDQVTEVVEVPVTAEVNC